MLASTHFSLKNVVRWKGGLTDGNLPIQPIARTLILHRDKGTICPALERDTHARPFLGDGLDVCKLDLPFGAKFVGANEQYTVVCQHHDHVSSGQFEMRDVVFFEEFAVVGGLEPELSQCFALRVGSDNAVHADEASETDAVEAIGVEDGCSVSYSFSKIWIRVSKDN